MEYICFLELGSEKMDNYTEFITKTWHEFIKYDRVNEKIKKDNTK